MNTQTISEEKKIHSRPSIFKFIFSPSLEMEKIKQKPTIWMPLLITLLLGVITVVISSFIPNIVRIQEEQAAQYGMGVEGVQVFMMIYSVVTILVTVPIVLLISGAIMLGISKIFKGEGTFKIYFSVSTFLMLLLTIGQLINIVIAYFVDGQPNFTSVNGMLNATGSLGDLFTYIEIFTIWTCVLTGLAFHKIGKLSKGISIVLGILTFILALIIGMLTGGLS